jgi:hypothetical protein
MAIATFFFHNSRWAILPHFLIFPHRLPMGLFVQQVSKIFWHFKAAFQYPLGIFQRFSSTILQWAR